MTDVAALQGGWAAWKRANYPVEPARIPTPTADAGTLPALEGEETPGAIGRDNAPVIMLEFSDYQCPYCKRYASETMPKIMAKYVETGQVLYMFRDLPLPMHDKAQKAAEAARCAGAQGAFWEMHDQLFDAQGEWSGREFETAVKKFVDFAEDLGLDVAAFEQCLESGEFAAAIAQDVQDAKRFGVSSTPSFLINGQLVVGAYPYEYFEEIIEAALNNQQ